MYQFFIKTVTVVAVIVVMICEVQSNEIREEIVEKRGQTLADVIKELNELKKKVHGIVSRRLLVLRGRNGRNGQQGPPGRDGRDGKGQQGPPGPSGKHGARGPPGRSGGGVEYIRWGKTSCPAGADIVYKGRIGGGYYDHSGGGSNYICLPMNPKYLNYKPGNQVNAYIYGTEYEVYRFNPFSKSNLYNHDAPCVACHVKTRSSKLMIPATYKCPSGWTREYYGYLMAERYSHKHSSEFICVDRDPEVVPGSKADLDGALLYPVEGVCGSLPCNPYVGGRELTCAVCTK